MTASNYDPAAYGEHLAADAYASPLELDLMARLGGLRLRKRWSTWTRTPFTGTSTRHISIYDRPE